MTRKHYTAIAMVLHDNYVDLKIRPHLEGAILPFEVMLDNLCHVMKTDNPNFNPTKFKEVVYGK